MKLGEKRRKWAITWQALQINGKRDIWKAEWKFGGLWLKFAIRPWATGSYRLHVYEVSIDPKLAALAQKGAKPIEKLDIVLNQECSNLKAAMALAEEQIPDLMRLAAPVDELCSSGKRVEGSG